MPAPPSRVARIPYLNSVPYYVNWPSLVSHSEGRWASTALPPRQLGIAMATGGVDAGLIPVADLIRLESLVAPLEVAVPVPGALRLGIACRGRVDSVLLFVRDSEGGGRPLTGRRPSTKLDSRDLDTLHGARVALTEESSTSVRLLRLLLEVRHGLRPLAYERQTLYNFGVSDEKRIDKRFAAALVIGDQALRWRVRPPDGFVQAMDLACEWCDWTGLPFVFACWCVRRDLAPDRAGWLGQFLIAALDEAGQDLSRLTHGLPADLGPTAALTEYLRNFIYRLGPDELESIARFRALLEASRIECSAD